MTKPHHWRRRRWPATNAELYNAAKEALGWSHEKMGHICGVTERTPYRYSSGEVEMPPPAGQLLKLLVLLNMTMSASKFDAIVEQLLESEAKRRAA